MRQATTSNDTARSTTNQDVVLIDSKLSARGRVLNCFSRFVSRFSGAC